MRTNRIHVRSSATLLRASVVLAVLAFGGCPSEQGNPGGEGPDGGASGVGETGATGLLGINVGGVWGTDGGPSALSARAATFSGTPVTIELRAQSPTGAALRFAISSAPAVGELSELSPAGEAAATVTYTPPADFVGETSFGFSASDGERSATGAVTVSVHSQVWFELDLYAGDSPLTVIGRAATVEGDALPEGTYTWNWGDAEDGGTVTTHGQRQHTFSGAGTYLVTLTLTLAGVGPVACNHTPAKTSTHAQVIAGGDAAIIAGQLSSDEDGSPLAGVRVVRGDGLGQGMSDPQGRFAVAVPKGWSGTIRPVDPGYTFSPAELVFTYVTAGTDGQNFKGKPVQLSLSGKVLDGGGQPVSGVAIGGLPGGPVTDASGNYTAKVKSGFSGTATPSKSGYTFTPTSRSYTKLTASKSSENYTASAGATQPKPGVLAVTPGSGLSAAGKAGGPFSPASAQYTLQNTGETALNWSAGKSQGWVSLSKQSGTLAAGASELVEVSINSGAATLPAGNYSDAVSFTNTTSGALSAAPAVELAVTPAPNNCVTSNGSWQNSAFAAQSGTFTAEFDVIPGGASIDAVTGLSLGAASAYTNLATIVRFNSGGTIDVRNGSTYQATTPVGYSAGTSYHFRMAVNVPGHTYSVYVTPQGGNEITLASNYAFRTEQAAVGSLDNLGIIANPGTHQVCNFAVSGGLAVSPGGGFSSAGSTGGPFSPGSQQYTLQNTSGAALNWTASKTQPWVTLSSTSGTLNAGGSVIVTASLNSNANALAVGNYNDMLTFTNATTGVGNTARVVSLTVSAPLPGTLSVTPAGGLSSSGQPGGPFAPSNAQYTLQNTGSQAINWTASKTQSWVTLSATSGALNPGASTIVTVTINSGANSLAIGNYNDIVTFSNTTNGNGNTTRNVGLAVSAVQMASQISQYGITWTFDKAYPVGQFVNGDWWVTPSSAGGTVNVVSVSPAPSGTPGTTAMRNGSMVNPLPPTPNYYDGRAYNPTAGVSFPLALSADQSLVSTISREEGAPFGGPNPQTWVKTAAILTCVASAPSATAFRPAYCGPKVLYDAATLRADLLPKLSPVAGTPSLATVEAYFERPWLDHKSGWTGRSIHPLDNMPDYGREIADRAGDGALMLLLDPNVIGDKSNLLRRYVQLGIDLYGVSLAGGEWKPDGGHGQGRKWPVVFAGLMLGDEVMRNIGTTEDFQEDGQSFYVSQADVNVVNACEYSGTAQGGTANTITLSNAHPSAYSDYVKGNRIWLVGGTGAGQMRVATEWNTSTKVATVAPNWNVIPDATTQYEVRGYEADMIGSVSWGIQHTVQPIKDNPSWFAVYIDLNLPYWYGHCLAARVLGQQNAWGHSAYFDLVDAWAAKNPPSGTFRANMWNAYRPSH